MTTNLPPDRLRTTDLPYQMGRYTLVGILGEGGMARVFRATLEGPGGFRKDVALKVILDPGREGDSDHEQGLSREARLCGLLKHPNVVDVYDFGEVEGSQYIAMEVIHGMSLRELIRQLGALPPSVCLEIISSVCDGLLHAHGLMVEGQNAGLVHRDLTPGNIMIDRTGITKIMDFGLARAGLWEQKGSADETLRGTPPFMSPEQIEKGVVDHRSDVFALGAIIYEIVTGERFFEGPTSMASLMKVQGVETWIHDSNHMDPLDGVVPGLAEVVRKCLRKDPADRYKDAEELRLAIEALRRETGLDPNLRNFIEQVLTGADTQIFALNNDADTWNVAHTADAQTAHVDPTTETVLDKLVPRTNLGAERSVFIGRSFDIEQIDQLFDAKNRLVTLTGQGGSGKTRLALHYARTLLNEGVNNQELWWCDLSAVQNLDGLVRSVASAMSLEIPLQVTAKALVEKIGQALSGSADVLLVLDNFEQVAHLAGETVGYWLDSSPGSRFLITSQTRLHLRGEAIHSLGALDDNDAITLYRQRARQAGAALENLSQDVDALIELIQRLDGLPLAIELAAGHAQIFSPKQILDRMASRFRLLKRKGADAPERHQSLEQALEWSWGLLQPWEQACLAQLSVFVGGFTLEQAEQVVDLRAHIEAPWVVFVVESLIDRSLVYANTTSDPSGQIRFGMSESVIDFAKTKLGADELDTFKRHGDCFARYGSISYIESLRKVGGDKRRLALEADIANLTTAAERGIEHEWAEVATHTTQVAMVLYNTLGPLRGALELGSRILEMPSLTERQRCRMYLGVGWSTVYVQREESIVMLNRALALAEKLEDDWLTIVSLTNIGAAWLQMGRPARARGFLEDAVRLGENRDLLKSSLTAMVNLGMVCAEAGDNDDALEYYERGLQMAKEMGNQRTQCQALTNLGDLYRTRGDPVRSREVIEQALHIAKNANYVRMQCISYFNLAELEYEDDNLTLALQLIDMGLNKLQVMGGNFKNMSLMLAYRAMVRAKAGDLAGMRSDLEQSLGAMNALETVGAWHVQSLCYCGHAEVYAGQLDAARTILGRADEMVASLGPATVGRMVEAVGVLRKAIDDQSER